MIDKRFIGLTLPEFSVTAEAGQMKFFAKAIGETNPVYTDEVAARGAGHPRLPILPTYFFSLAILQPSKGWREEMGLNPARILHGEQSFTYHRMAYAGDTLRFRVRISDIYEKKGGALDFVERETQVINQRDELVAELRGVLVHRNG